MSKATANKTQRRLANQNGFTMIEILMALIILTLGLMAYGVTSGSIMTRNTHSTQESIATTLAQDQLEILKNSSLAPLPSNNETVNEAGETTGSHRVYTRSYTTSLVAGHACDCFYDISVTVGWNNNGNHSVTLNTQISQ